MDDQSGEQIRVKLPQSHQSDQMIVGLWLLNVLRRPPTDWIVYRGETQLGNWDFVTNGETVIVKPKPAAS